jgi:hypothetical protein
VRRFQTRLWLEIVLEPLSHNCRCDRFTIQFDTDARTYSQSALPGRDDAASLQYLATQITAEDRKNVWAIK